MGRFFRQPLWTKPQSLVLIKKLKNYPVLYDQNHQLYLNKRERVKAIRSLCEKIKAMKPSCTPRLLGKKINHFKFEFTREQQKIANPPPDSLTPGVPTLWCYDELKALYTNDTNSTEDPDSSSEYLDEEMQNGKQDDFPDAEDSVDSIEKVRVEHVDVQKIKTEKHRSKSQSQFHTKCTKLLDMLSKEILTAKEDKMNGETPNKQNKPQTFLGMMVESELSAVSHEIFIDAKWKIMRILEEASKRELELKATYAHQSSQLTQISTLSPHTNSHLENQSNMNLSNLHMSSNTGSR